MDGVKLTEYYSVCRTKRKHKNIGIVTSQCTTTNFGTGMLISPNIVLTAAHNIYGCKGQKVYKEIKYYHNVFG